MPTISVNPPPVVYRSRFKQLIQLLKPRSIAWRTTALVGVIVIFSQVMALLFFWRTLYLPELKHHAKNLAVDVLLLQDATSLKYKQKFDDEELDFPVRFWLEEHLPVKIISDPEQFPKIKNKKIAEFFTREVAKELSSILEEPVTVYFQFKPSPRLWVQTSSMKNTWLLESLDTYAHYQLEIILLWLIGSPIISIWIILILVRQLSRPLKRLQAVAQNYTQNLTTTTLDTMHGSIEIRQVNHAFNQMIERIQTVETERKTMLGGISHDLRTPLTRMRLMVEMLEDDYLKQDFIIDIDEMDEILQQFLSYIKGGEEEDFQLVRIDRLIEEIVATYRHLHIELKISTKTEVELKVLSFKRMLGNLLRNAEKYGKEPISIELIDVSTELLLIVEDAGELGSHLTEQQLSELFVPFKRADEARTEHGTGLGLAIVERVIRAHHGEISLDTNKTGGFRFKIKLPKQQEHQSIR